MTLNVEKLLYLTKKGNIDVSIDDLNEGILFADTINEKDNKHLIIKISNDNKNEEVLIYFFVGDKPTIRKYKKQFWLERTKIKHFTEDLILIFNIDEDKIVELREKIFRELHSTYGMWINRDNEDEDKEPEEILSEEEEYELIKLLDNPKLFEIIKDKMSLWCEGNDMQKVFLYVIGFTTYFKNPELVGIIGNSSSGKSHLVKSVMRLSKQEKWEKLASSSSKGFYYNEIEWEGRRLFLLEVQGLNDENMVLLRTWWSEGGDMNLSHITVDKNSAGQMVGAKKVLKKPPFGIFTSAVPEVENQLSTRMWRVHADDSENQHRRIKNMIADDAIFEVELDLNQGLPVKIFQHIEDYIETNVHIIIPYAHEINLNNYKESRVNRDIKKMYNAIRCFALLSQRRRLMFICGEKTYLISEIEDYENFIRYGGLIFSNTLKDIDDDMRRTINLFIENLNHGNTTLNISNVAMELGMNNRPKIKRILDELHNKNILTRYKGERNAWTYEMTNESKTKFNNQLENVTTDLTTDKTLPQLQELVNKLKYDISCKIIKNDKDKKIFEGSLNDLKEIRKNIFPSPCSGKITTELKKPIIFEKEAQEVDSFSCKPVETHITTEQLNIEDLE